MLSDYLGLNQSDAQYSVQYGAQYSTRYGALCGTQHDKAQEYEDLSGYGDHLVGGVHRIRHSVV